MNSTATTLDKAKKDLAKLNKNFPKGKTYMGFTIDISYGGNKTPDHTRISLGGVASRQDLSSDFLALIKEAMEDNVKFWGNECIKELEELNKVLHTDNT